MQIKSILTGLNHPLISTHFSYDPKLYLEVIGNDQLMARCGLKTLPEFSAPWGYVGIGSRKPSRSSSNQVKIWMNPSCLGICMVRQLRREILHGMAYPPVQNQIGCKGTINSERQPDLILCIGNFDSQRIN